MVTCKKCGKIFSPTKLDDSDFCPECQTEKSTKTISNDAPNKGLHSPQTSVNTSQDEPSNKIATILYFVGTIIIIIGCLFGLFQMFNYIRKLAPMLMIASSFISGMFFIALGEIISLLYKIANK